MDDDERFKKYCKSDEKLPKNNSGEPVNNNLAKSLTYSKWLGKVFEIQK